VWGRGDDTDPKGLKEDREGTVVDNSSDGFEELGPDDCLHYRKYSTGGTFRRVGV